MSVEIIIQFVERKMSTQDFLKHLYENEQLKKLISEPLTFESYVGDNLYLYLVDKNMENLADLVDCLGALKRFLRSKDIDFEENDKDKKLYRLLLDSQPSWLNLPDFYLQKLLKEAGEIKGTELKKFLKDEMKKRFKCMKGTSRWLQGGSWIFVDEEPLLFVGQLDITELRHDTSRLYVFLDEKTGEYHTIEQSM